MNMAIVGLTFCFRLKHRSQARLFFCGRGCVCGLDCEELGLRLARAGFGSERREFSRQSVCMLDLLQGDTWETERVRYALLFRRGNLGMMQV
jgi:hypothetical protein